MEPINTRRGYAKVGDNNQSPPRHRRRTAIAIAGSTALLLLIAIAVAVDRLRTVRSTSSPIGALASACRFARDPAFCFSSLTAAGANATTDPIRLLAISLSVAGAEIDRIGRTASANDRRAEAALKDCEEVIGGAADRVNASINLVRAKSALTSAEIGDLQTWLSAALTDQETCIDSFEGAPGPAREKITAALRRPMACTSNSLAIAAHFLELPRGTIHRKLLCSPLCIQSTI
ncbi:pectinesterase 3-like [Wolffia australiana]